MRIRAAGKTDVGCVRKHNEDSYLADDSLGLFVVADGLGGHAAGEVASQIVVDTVARFVGDTQEKDRTWPMEYDPSLSYDGNRLKVALLPVRAFQLPLASLAEPPTSSPFKLSSIAGACAAVAPLFQYSQESKAPLGASNFHSMA